MKKSKPQSPGRGRVILFGAMLIVVSLIIIEIVLRIAASQGLISIRVHPTRGGREPIRFLGDLNPHFGSWHRPNTNWVSHTPGGRIEYASNAHGMRDRERTFSSFADTRVVVLGDSFVEGHGVNMEDRFTDILEEQTGIEFLNFGTSGNFGSIQQWMLYRNLALEFDHSHVLLFFLPDNDFTDNRRPSEDSGRYRPFLAPTNGGYNVVYPFPFDEVDERRKTLSASRKFKNHVYNKWYLLNLLRNLDFDTVKENVRPSSYDNFSEEDAKQLIFSYEKIAELAHPRPVTIFVIPRDHDFNMEHKNKHEGRILSHLYELADRHTNIRIVDMMPGFLDYISEQNIPHTYFFLGYDPHWSPLGHNVAAKIILQTSSENSPFPP